MPGDEINITEYWIITRGASATYKFRMIPLNAVGATASMTSALGVFTLTLDNEFQGPEPYVDVSLTFDSTATNAFVPGVYEYQTLMVFPDTTVLACGKGSIVVQ